LLATGDQQKAIDDLIDFWFADTTKPRWYDSNDAFDKLCEQRFEEAAQKAALGDLHAWEQSAKGALALVLLLDQIPRNIYRGTERAFASDRLAVAVTERAIDRGFDQQLDLEKRKFLYLPFMHSEDLTEQERSVALAEALGDEKTVHYAKDHADVIRQFGRFPHRNAILGRQATAEEDAFLAAGANNYGQTVSTGDQSDEP